MGGETEVDADAMARDADSLGVTGGELASVRDGLNSAWKRGPDAFGSTPATAAFDECSRAWVGALHSLAFLVHGLGTYTQEIANAYGAADTTMSGWISEMYTPDDLPKKGETRTEPDPDLIA